MTPTAILVAIKITDALAPGGMAPLQAAIASIGGVARLITCACDGTTLYYTVI